MCPSPACAASRPGSRGATLIELAVMLAIAGVLAAFALPSYRDWIAETRLRGQSEALASTLNRARSAAIRIGTRVTVCKSADQRRCSAAGGWDQGWLVFVDEDRDGARDDDEVTLYVEGPAHPGVTIAANRPLVDYVSYTPIGHPRLVNGALQMGTFVACISGRNGMNIVVAHSGRVRLERSRDRCP
jgi:type IV fimbrial biogenesis protein FimT